MIIRKIPTPFNISFYFLIVLYTVESLMPFESINGSSSVAKALLLLVYLVLAIVGNNLIPKSLSNNISKLPNNRTFNLIRIFTFLGPIFLLVDRIYSRGIDFSLGITSMRQTMIRESSGGISSFFSVSGYLGSAMAFLLLTRLIIFTNNQSKKTNIIDAVLIFYSVIGVSILTGGRSTIFILFGFLYASFYCKINLFKNKIIIKTKQLFYFILMLSFIIYYVNYIFQDRATLSNIDAKDYYSSIIYHLKGKEKSNVNLNDKSDFYIYSQLTMAYFIHQLWVLDLSLDLNENLKKGDSTFISWKTILSKTGLIKKPEKWFYSGFYIPLIGTYIYSYGLFFGIMFFLLFMWTIFIIIGNLIRKSHSFINLFLFNLGSFVLIFSVMLPSTEVLMIPIICITLVFIYPIFKFISRFRLI